jgi:hypothetical protein
MTACISCGGPVEVGGLDDNPVGTSEDAVVGGRPESGYPAAGYMAIDAYQNGSWYLFCGATLAMSKDIAITAAHCIKPYPETTPRALGFGRWQSGPLAAAKAIMHPQYNDKTVDHDIAILVLDQPVTNVQPAALATATVGACNYRSIGYGRVTEGPPDRPDGYTDERKSTQVCVTGGGGRGIYKIKPVGGGLCYGDSGGPTMVEGTNQIISVESHAYVDSNCRNGVEEIQASVADERAALESMVYSAHLAKHLYRYYYGREPGNVEFSRAARDLILSPSAQDARNRFLTSPEQASRISNRDYVTSLYRRYLGREPDAAGLASWAQKLDSGNMTRVGLRDTFINTPEAAVRVSNQVFAQQLYLQLLGRAGSSTELAGRVNELASGTQRHVLVRDTLNSAEFKRRDLTGVVPSATLTRIFDFSGLP